MSESTPDRITEAIHAALVELHPDAAGRNCTGDWAGLRDDAEHVAARVRAALAADNQDLRDRIATAQFVAEHWRAAAMQWNPPEPSVSHPLCMVLSALDGQTDPHQLGIEEHAHAALARARELAGEHEKRERNPHTEPEQTHPDPGDPADADRIRRLEGRVFFLEGQLPVPSSDGSFISEVMERFPEVLRAVGLTPEVDQ